MQLYTFYGKMMINCIPNHLNYCVTFIVNIC